MTGKEYLERPGKLKQEILADQDNIAAMRSVVEQCTTHLSLTAGCNPSKNKDSFENVMLSITEAEKELEEKVKHLAQMKINIINNQQIERPGPAGSASHAVYRRVILGCHFLKKRSYGTTGLPDSQGGIGQS